MKYSWASITQSCTNFGNYQIEYTLKKILSEKKINEPVFSFDAFQEQPEEVAKKINESDFLIIPGCTTLNLHHYFGIKSIISKIEKPIYNIGATFFEKPNKGSYDYYKYFFKPIGTRDPVSTNFLKENNVPCEFIGCPTLFSGNAHKIKLNNSNKIIFIFGLNNVHQQIRLFNLLRKKYEVKIIVQEEKQLDFIKNLDANYAKYSPEILIKELEESKLLVTGRLHGALPAIACGVPVFFIQTIPDIRFSLLEYLNIRINQIDDNKIEDKLLEALEVKEEHYTEIYSRVWELKQKFWGYIDKVYQDLS